MHDAFQLVTELFWGLVEAALVNKTSTFNQGYTPAMILRTLNWQCNTDSNYV